jgi:hypothetical protein
MTDIATCLHVVADCLAAARFCSSEAELAREYADAALADLPADLAATIDQALADGDWGALDQIANAFEPPVVRRRKPRKPRRATLVKRAEKAVGKPVTSVTMPDGMTINFGETTKSESENAFDQWAAKHARSTERH